MPSSIFKKINCRIAKRLVCYKKFICNEAHIFFRYTTCSILAGGILFLATSNLSLFAQTNPVNNNAAYTISKRFLSIEDRLASHEVFCGVQDKAGFLWFGTSMD
jgi:hypothetical protein